MLPEMRAELGFRLRQRNRRRLGRHLTLFDRGSDASAPQSYKRAHHVHEGAHVQPCNSAGAHRRSP